MHWKSILYFKYFQQKYFMPRYIGMFVNLVVICDAQAIQLGCLAHLLRDQYSTDMRFSMKNPLQCNAFSLPGRGSRLMCRTTRAARPNIVRVSE